MGELKAASAVPVNGIKSSLARMNTECLCPLTLFSFQQPFFLPSVSPLQTLITESLGSKYLPQLLKIIVIIFF